MDKTIRRASLFARQQRQGRRPVVVERSDAARSEVSGNGLAAPVASAMVRAASK